MTHIAEVTGVVLAGGLGSRAGGPKAAVELEGETLCARAARRIGAVTAQVLVCVRNPGDAVPAGTAPVADDPAGAGPLVAVTCALEACPTPWAFIAACDLPDLDDATMRFLIERAQAGTADVVVPVDGEGRLQPLHAVYHTAIAPRLRGMIDAGERSLVGALATLACDAIQPDTWARFPGASASLAGLNTAAEIEARRAVGGRA